MNRHIGTMAFLFALILNQGCTDKDDTTSKEHAQRDVITQEEGRIITTLNEAADAESNFYSTKDSSSVLRFYAQDYMGIKDGRSETVKDHEKYFAKVLEQITLANPSGFRPSSRISSRASRGGSGGQRMSMNTKSGGAEGRAVCFNRFHKGTVLPFSESRKIHGSYATNIVRRQVLRRFNPEINRDVFNRVVVTWHQCSLTSCNNFSTLIGTSELHSVSPIAYI